MDKLEKVQKKTSMNSARHTNSIDFFGVILYDMISRVGSQPREVSSVIHRADFCYWGEMGGKRMPYYAHIRQDENGETFYQTVAEHLTGTAALCREFAADFGAEADGDLMGLAHDLGKCTDAFQKRLLEGGPVVDHTMAGMLTCIKMKRPSAAA